MGRRVPAMVIAASAPALLLLFAPSATAAADQWCTEFAGSWDGTTCSLFIESQRKAHMRMTIQLPVGLSDDPVAGPVLHDYYRRLVTGWRSTGLSTPRDSSARAEYTVYPGPGGLQSVVVHETFEPFGIQSNNAYRSFVFDRSSGRRLALADLFKPGIDAHRVVSTAAAPLLPGALDAAPPPHSPGTYPFTIEEWHPSSDGSGYSGDHRAFAVTANALQLYMPDQPMQRETPWPPDRLVWSMDGGTITLEIPLAALAGSLRPEYGGK